MVIVRFGLIFLASLIIASCAGIGFSEGEWATLYGQVISGPTCPNQINVSGCEDQPVKSAVLIVLDSEGREVTRSISDENGQFSLQLRLGRYYVMPLPVPGFMGTPDKLEIVVDKIPLTPITIKYDTGIRSVTPPSPLSK